MGTSEHPSGGSQLSTVRFRADFLEAEPLQPRPRVLILSRTPVKSTPVKELLGRCCFVQLS